MLTNVELLTASLAVDLARARGYYWDKQNGQYVSRWNGRPVDERTVRLSVERYNSVFVRQNIANLTQRFIDGAIDLATWQTRMANEIKQAWLINYAVGRGGRAMMTYSDFGKIGAGLRMQYRFLNEFALEIAAGQLTPAQILARAGLYAGSTRQAYFAGMTKGKQEAGYTHEQRFLSAAEHCEDCIRYADQGRVPIGSLPEPGQASVCDGNCKCRKVYYREGE